MNRKTDIALAVAPADLALLIRTVDLGSFSAVARERNVPVSSVSRAVVRLEEIYGLRLLRRSTHGLSLTPEGQAVVDYGRQALTTLGQLADRIMTPREQISGTVRLGLSNAMAEAMIIPGLPELQARYPDLCLELLADDRPVDLTLEGVDLALRTGQVVNDNLVAREVGHYRRALYCAPGFAQRHGLPRHPDELGRFPLISHLSVRQLNPLRFLIDGRVEERLLPGQFSANSTALVAQMVLAGMGIGLLTVHLARDWLAAGQLIRVLPEHTPDEPHPIYVVMPADRHRLPRIRVVADFLAQRVAASTRP